MWIDVDSQEVGLEAAILERKRNSSLVKLICAENVTGLSTAPKLREGWGQPSVGEHSEGREGLPEGGLERSEALMQTRVASNGVQIPIAASLRVPGYR